MKPYLGFEYSFNSLSCRKMSFLAAFKKSFIKIGSVLLAGEFTEKDSTSYGPHFCPDPWVWPEPKRIESSILPNKPAFFFADLALMGPIELPKNPGKPIWGGTNRISSQFVSNWVIMLKSKIQNWFVKLGDKLEGPGWSQMNGFYEFFPKSKSLLDASLCRSEPSKIEFEVKMWDFIEWFHRTKLRFLRLF